MDFKKEYKKLLGIAKRNLLQAGKPCRNEDIAKKLGYTRSYLSQLIGERGVVTKDHINTFKLHFKEMLENTTSEESQGSQVATSKDLSSLIESNLIMSRSIEKNTNNMAEMIRLLSEKTSPVNFDEVKENQMLLLAYQKTLFHHIARLQAKAEKADLSKIEHEMGKSLTQYVEEVFQTDKQGGK